MSFRAYILTVGILRTSDPLLVTCRRNYFDIIALIKKRHERIIVVTNRKGEEGRIWYLNTEPRKLLNQMVSVADTTSYWDPESEHGVACLLPGVHRMDIFVMSLLPMMVT